MLYTISLYLSLALFVIGLVIKVSNWLRFKISPAFESISVPRRIFAAARGIVATVFSGKIGILVKLLFTDVLWQRWLLQRGFLRWLAHMCIYAGFMLLLLMHGLDKLIMSPLFDEYYPTVNPYVALRDLFGLLVIVGLALVAYRRLFSKAPRPKTTGVDVYAIIILTVIMVSGFLLKGTKIVSQSSYQEMVEEYSGLGEEDQEDLKALEAYWVDQFGVVSPTAEGPFDEKTLNAGRQLHEMSCAECHSRPQWALISYTTSRAAKPLAAFLDRAGVPTLLWYVHFIACFFGLAYLPFSKFFHIFATPLFLMARAVIKEGQSDPANTATLEAMQLDACTHCGECTTRCSVAVAFNEIPNPNILPSEKLAALRTLLSGRGLGKRPLAKIQEGSHICTDCHRCTDVCPVGINLDGLWSNLNRRLAEVGYPKPEAWARTTIGAAHDLTRLGETTWSLTPVDKGFLNELTGSAQANSFTVCFGCQNCTNVCPVVANYENPKETVGLLPHEIMHALALKQKELALGPRMLWDCTTCYMCQEHCPQGVRVTDVLYELKSLALKDLKAKAA